MTDAGFVRTSTLADFFGISEIQLRSWLSTKIAPDNLRVPGRSDGPRLADPEVKDSDLCTAADICAFYRISSETLRRWINLGKFPKPDNPLPECCRLWKVRTARDPKLKLRRQKKDAA